MALYSRSLTVTPEEIYSSSGTTAVTVMYFCNSGTQPTNFYVYAVPAGQTISTDRCIYYNISLTPNDTYVIDNEKLVLENGDKLFANIASPLTVGTRVIATVSAIGV
jgi:hypothetical protein